jgi:hypothetical protein
MTISPKSMQVLIDLKKELLSAPQSVIITLSDPPKMRKAPISKVGMRHAKAPNAYQRWKQRHNCW